jgi:hypothetical protein
VATSKGAGQRRQRWHVAAEQSLTGRKWVDCGQLRMDCYAKWASQTGDALIDIDQKANDDRAAI